MKKERSRAYPLVDLERAVGLLGELSSLGSESLDRLAIAEGLGYSSGEGGIAARKIGALVHFGLLDRHLKQYRISARGRQLLSLAPESPEHRRVLRNVLEQPFLFRSVLESYRPIGKIPEDLAPVLAHQHGITVRASGEAAQVFRQSACFAGVLGTDGSFIDLPYPTSQATVRQPRLSRPVAPGEPVDRGDAGVQRLPLLLPNRRLGHLEIPSEIDKEDFNFLVEGLSFWLRQLHAHAGLGDLPAGRVLQGVFSGGKRGREPER